MDFEYPEKYVEPEYWDQYLIDNVPALRNLWQKGKYDVYETWKVLNNLTHEDYVRDHVEAGLFYAPYMPLLRRAMPKLMAQSLVSVQPMSEPTGKIFEFNSKKEIDTQ